MRKSIRLSQNFLKSRRLVARLIDISLLGKEDTVVEIGPGKGIITEALVTRCREVIAVEADPMLAHALQAKFAYMPNLRVHTGSFLHFTLPSQPYKVFANIPFNLTADILKKLLDAPLPPDDSYLIMQREAAQKFAGRPGKETLLSVTTKPWFDYSIVFTFRPEDFMPQPQVTVVMLRLKHREQPLVLPTQAEAFRDFVAYTFHHATPTIHHVLTKLLLEKELVRLRQLLHLHESAVPSQVAFEDWLALFAAFYSQATPKQAKLINGAYDKVKQDAASIEKSHRTRLDKNWRSFKMPPRPATS